MTEKIELRVREIHASRIFGEDEGERLGHGLPYRIRTRKVTIRSDDPRIADIVRIHLELRDQNDFLFGGSGISRKYLKQELDTAELMWLRISSTFQPAGEECGTVYDDSTGCAVCGAGALQRSELFLNLSKIPRSKDVATTIALNEVVVSQRFVDAVRSGAATGLDFLPVQPSLTYSRGRSAIASQAFWQQLNIISSRVDIVPPTRIGKSPFWEQLPGCPLGHRTAQWPLSELSVDRSSWNGADFSSSNQLFGIRRGLLRPFPQILVTQRARRTLDEHGLKGFWFEVAHFV